MPRSSGGGECATPRGRRSMPWRWGRDPPPPAPQPHPGWEVDGYGNFFFADDANIPGLLSLPFLGYVPPSDPTYQATRRLLLNNETNPMFFGSSEFPSDGGVLGGIGSEDASGNAGLGHVWPLSLTVRLLTLPDDDSSDAEALAILRALRESSGGTGLMHESYWFDDPSQYTRYWFAMANSYYGESLLQLATSRPHLLFSDAARPPNPAA
jgi:meiotically up-regulated gene 157 (Mug157) protein